MDVRRLVSKSISNDIMFSNTLVDSAQTLFNNEKLITLYDKDGVILKGILTNQNDLDVAYYVKFEKDTYSVYVSKVPCYIETIDKSIEYILSHTFSYNGIDKDTNLKISGIEWLISYETMSTEMSSEDIDYLESNMENLSYETVKDKILNIINNSKPKTYPIFSNELSSIKNYLSFINTMGIDFTKSDDELLTYLSNSLSSYQGNICDLGLRLEFIKSLKDKFTEENKFEYNDLDNYIWNQEGYIFVENQNVLFICNFEDRNNFTVYPIVKDLIPNKVNYDEYIKSRFEKIKAKNINLIDDCGIIVENGILKYISEIDFYIFELDISCGVECIQEEYNLYYMDNSNIDVDITTVKYMRDYLYTFYSYNRFDFCSHVFLVLGTEFDYDSTTGKYKSNSITYREDIKECPLDDDYKSKCLYGTYDDYVKISFLDKEWKDELTWFHNKLVELDNKGHKFIVGGSKSTLTVDIVIKSIEPFIEKE